MITPKIDIRQRQCGKAGPPLPSTHTPPSHLFPEQKKKVVPSSLLRWHRELPTHQVVRVQPPPCDCQLSMTSTSLARFLPFFFPFLLSSFLIASLLNVLGPLSPLIFVFFSCSFPRRDGPRGRLGPTGLLDWPRPAPPTNTRRENLTSHSRFNNRLSRHSSPCRQPTLPPSLHGHLVHRA